MPKYQATEYVRLSYADDRMNESDSITNQKKLIADFLKGHPEIELVSERIDDGYSGILFDRPAFQEMMDDIRSGKINCVIVKDLSRLGREYIETGRYLRQIFPAYGVRFIAITDGIDTANDNPGDDLTVSMKSIINDAYCHDISVKTRSALLTKRKDGDYVGSCPIYGYRKSPENKNQLVPDEQTARVVQDIFRSKIDGASAAQIAKELNDLGVLSPLAYKISRGLPHPKKGFADSQDARWSATTVLRILKDETYTGVLIQGRQGTYNYKIKDVIDKPESQWIRVENAHKAIIRKQDFDLVQKILGLDTRTSPGHDKVYLFSGILICGCCGERMTRKTVPYKDKKYFYYFCPKGKKNGCTGSVMLKENDLITCVLESLKAQINNVVSLEQLLDSINEEQINRELIEQYKIQIADNEAQLAQIRRFKSILYENFVSGFLDKDEYKTLKDDYSSDMARLQAAIDRLRQKMEDASNNTSERLRWAEHFKRFSTMTELDRRAVIALIQSIEVVGKEKLNITFRYQSEYDKAIQLLQQRGILISLEPGFTLTERTQAMLRKEAV